MIQDAWQFISTLSKEQIDHFLWYWLALAVCSGALTLFVGQLPVSSRAEHSTLEFLGTINKRTGWIIMETPILLSVATGFLQGDHPWNPAALIVAFFFVHYVNRALVYPYRIKVSSKTMPVFTMLASMLFYIVNGYLVGYYLGALVQYPVAWLWDPRFLLGASVFIAGMFINIQSDNILINLRAPGETGYKIPQGGCYRWVSCPNYLGECMEWIGFALMSWNMMGFVYAVWVVMPVFPQALIAHRWYLEKFGDSYPKNRKAIIPGVI